MGPKFFLTLWFRAALRDLHRQGGMSTGILRPAASLGPEECPEGYGILRYVYWLSHPIIKPSSSVRLPPSLIAVDRCYLRAGASLE
jgi:hypothetical protein